MNRTRAGLALAALLAGAPMIASGSDGSGPYIVVEGGVLSYDTSALLNYYGFQSGFIPYWADSLSWGYQVGSSGFVGYPVKGIIGYQFNSRWAVEASALAVNKVAFTFTNVAGQTVSATSRATGASGTLVAIASGGQPGDYLSLFVKGGASIIHSTSTINSPYGGTLSPLGQGNKIGITYGIALVSDVTENFGFRFDWDSYRLPANASGGRFNTWLFGAWLKY